METILNKTATKTTLLDPTRTELPLCPLTASLRNTDKTWDPQKSVIFFYFYFLKRIESGVCKNQKNRKDSLPE